MISTYQLFEQFEFKYFLIFVKNLKDTISWYTKFLGTPSYVENIYAEWDKYKFSIQENPKISKNVELIFHIKNIDDIYKKFENVAKFKLRKVMTRKYEFKIFSILDPNGNEVVFKEIIGRGIDYEYHKLDI